MLDYRTIHFGQHRAIGNLPKDKKIDVGSGLLLDKAHLYDQCPSPPQTPGSHMLTDVFLSRPLCYSALVKVLFFIIVTGVSSAFSQQVTNIESKGNLVSERSSPLKSLDEASSNDTPVDFFDLAARKLQEEKYDESSMAFMVASVYGAYDQRRVADQTAQQGLEVLIAQKMSSASPEKRKKLQESVEGLLTNSDGLLLALEKLGRPSYHPAYMIQHGVSESPKSQENKRDMVEGFDPESEWEKLLSEVASQ